MCTDAEPLQLVYSVSPGAEGEEQEEEEKRRSERSQTAPETTGGDKQPEFMSREPVMGLQGCSSLGHIREGGHGDRQGYSPGVRDSRTNMKSVWGLRRAMGPRCPPFPGRLGPPGPVCSWLQLVPPVFLSHLSGIPDTSGSHQLCQDPPGEVCKEQSAGAHQPCREPVDNVSIAMSPSASQTPLVKQPLPLASTVSPDPPASTCSVLPPSSQSASQPPELFLPLDSPSPQPLASSPPPPCPSDLESRPPSPTASYAPPPPDSTLTLPQCDPVALPLGAVPRSSSPHTPWTSSPAPAISGLGHPILAMPSQQVAAKACSISTSSQGGSKPVTSFWGDPGIQVVAGTRPLLSCDEQNLLEREITKNVKTKIYKEKEKDRSQPKQRGSAYSLNSLESTLKPLGAECKEGSEALGPCQAVNMSQPARVQGTVDSAGNECLQCPPKEKQRPPESSFGRRLRLFFQSILPHKKPKHQDALSKSKLSPATAQSQRSFTSSSIAENMDPEAQALMRVVGQILEKVAVFRGLHTTKMDKCEQEFKAPVRGCYHSHGHPGYPEPGKRSHTPGSHQTTQQGQRCSVKERQVRHQVSLKSGRFNNKPLDLRDSPSLSHKTLSSLVSRCQHGRAVPRIPGPQPHSLWHCLLRRRV
ncbi:hypothetical protein MC885_000453 [Smutsia gigantea]|nr:hypothetical protein MC885_000453 [Smutsia gigantea]